MSLLTELKRRNVFRVSAAYLALCWVVTQVSGTVVPALHLPESIPAVVIWLSIIGFPFVVGFSWIFELTSEGLKRESDVDRSDPVTTRRLDTIVIAMLGLAILIAAVQIFRPVPFEPESASSVTEPDATSPIPSPSPVSAIAIDDKSIAVLPFADMSQAKDQEYMSDGIAEELMNLLTRVPDLKVIARTSSFAFKGQNIEIAEIAKRLNVAHVLEGSVRKSGNTLRITAQLIRTADSTHLWSETYDRPLDDIFMVQDEIAGAIVQALQIRLAGGELNRRKGGTQNLDAYQLYLRSWRHYYQNTQTSLKTAQEYAEQATKLDLDYGNALVLLASCAIAEADNGWIDPAEGYLRARKLAHRALEISPDLAEAHAVLQYVYLGLDWDWSAAEAQGRLALAIDSTNPLALNIAGKLSATLGQWEKAEREFRLSLVRDPLSTFVIWNIGDMYYRTDRLEEAESILRELLELEPDFGWTQTTLAKTLLAQGKSEEALQMVQEIADTGENLVFLPIVLLAAGREDEAAEALKAQIAHWSDRGAYFVALTYAYRGEKDLAFEWLDRSYLQREQVLTEILGEPLLDNLDGDPRFNEFLRKMKLPTQ